MKNFKMKAKVFLAAFSLILLLYFIYMINIEGALSWDEPVYLANARNHISHSNFSENFRFPLLSFTISRIWLIAGESILIAQLFVIFISISTLWVFYFICKTFFSKEIAFFSAISLGITQQFLIWGFRIYTDILGVFLFLLSLLFFIKAEKKRKHFLLISGIFSGLAFSARLSTLLVGAGIGIFLVLNKDRIKNILLFSSGFFISVLPWLIHGFFSYNDPFFFIFSQTSAILEYTVMQTPLIFLKLLITEFNFSLIFIFLSFAFFIYSYFYKKNNKFFFCKYYLVIILILVLQLPFYLFFVRLKLARYILELAPFIIILIFTGVYQVSFFYENKIKYYMKYFSIIFVILCLLYTTIFGLNELINQSRCTSTGALKESIEYLENIVSEGDIVVSSVWPYYGYYLNLEVYSSWTENIDYLLEEYNFNYLVISKRAGVVFETDVSHYSLVLLESFNDDCGFDIEIYKVID